DSELRSLSECTTRLKKTARISIRVNPNVAAETHPYVSTGTHQHKFGVPINRARWLYAQAASVKRLTVAGVSVHIGSQITESKPFAICMERVAELIKDLRADGHKIEFVDAGGGLGIDYRGASSTDFAALVADYADAILRPLRGLKVHVLLEPGRAIVGPAGILLTKTIYKKTNGNKSFVVVDAAMNDLIRPALYQAYHEIIPVTYGGRPQETVDVVGPVCETGDFFAHDRELPETSEGDLLAILDAGAYGMVQASNYNTRPRPAEVLVDGKTAKVVRRRETVADLIKHET
ncbi:MAG: diaminopimelate decarboxylase, partial [Acidobacteriaceae bacterium]